MKINKIFNISAGVALLLGATACSSDYLDLKPEGTLQYGEVLEGEEGATLAVNGMCAAMYKQYSAISDGSLGFNGEPSLLQYYGEVMGQDYVSLYWMLTGGTSLMNWDANGASQMNSASGSQVAWGYCYNLISMANNLLSFAPKQTDTNGEVIEKEYGVNTFSAYNPVPDLKGRYAFRYAQALTFRAHAYIHLMQIYCARWENRYTPEGEWSLTVPLRLDYQNQQSDLNCPLATWEELMSQIYADLQQAIEVYELSGTQRTQLWEPDENIAKGLLARAAMINHDWETAATMAKEARTQYPLMSVEEYQQGFANPNSEWMWTNSGESQSLYFWSFGATYACNGAYPCRWGNIGAGGINNDLMRLGGDMTNNHVEYDLRANLYFSPDIQPVFRSEFWESSQVEAQTMNINGQRGKLHDAFVKFVIDKYSHVEDFGWDPPYTYYGYPLIESGYYTTCAALFGAQFKFYGTDNYSASYYPFMRSSEMLLIEAEANYEMGKYTEADDLLKELNTNRFATDRYGDSRYTYSYSGQKLQDAIRYYRRMELWGEGFNWFDFKRWNVAIERRAWERGDINSGNWPETYSATMDQEVSNGWRWRIPVTELNYNEDIDRAVASYGYNW